VAHDDTVTAGGDLTVDLWWAVPESPELDYSLGLFLLDSDGAMVAETNLSLVTADLPRFRYTLDDGLTFRVPDYAERPTSTWDVGETIYSGYALAVPNNTPPDTYTLEVVVYHFETPDEPLTVEGVSRYRLGDVTITP
jgi:hypothetical protein